MFFRYRVFIVLVLSVLFIAYATAEAAEYVIQPDGIAGKDSWVSSSSPTTPHGDQYSVYFGGDSNGGENRFYIQFDLSTVASSSTVDLARLELYYFAQHGDIDYDYSVFRVTGAWSEASLTWNTQPTRESTAAFTFSGTEWDGASGSWRSITGLADLVKFWIDNPDQNHGMVIQPTSDFFGSPAVWGSDYVTAMWWPRLVLEGAIVDAESTTWGGVKSLYR